MGKLGWFNVILTLGMFGILVYHTLADNYLELFESAVLFFFAELFAIKMTIEGKNR